MDLSHNFQSIRVNIFIANLHSILLIDLERELKSFMSHPILQGKPNASHMCARINLHTHDRQNESNTIAVIKRTRV
jgi:hypothetical protein